MEQIILGNIQPRLDVKIHVIDHRDQTKAIVVIQIPDSYLKPHMNGRNGKFYKRYQFAASPMTEIEVNDAYRRRLIGYKEVESYILELLEHGFWEGEILRTPQIIGKIILIPTRFERMIDTSNINKFDWVSDLDFKPEYPSVFRCFKSRPPTPSSRGIRCAIRDKNSHIWEGLEVHRNGCIHSIGYFGVPNEGKIFFHVLDFCIAPLHAFQFASTRYQRYNYFGDVKVICNLQGTKDSWLRIPDAHMRKFRLYEDYPCQVSSINISRELPTNVVESRYDYITSGVMDEIFNCYGLWKCPLFDEEGNFDENSLR